MSQPRLGSVESGAGRSEPILPGSELVVKGERLRGELTKILIDGVEFTPAPQDVAETKILLSVPTTLRPGIRALQVLHELSIGTPSSPHRGVESNVAPFVLHPVISAPASAHAQVAVTFSPKVGRAQRVKLLLGETPVPADRVARGYAINAPANNGITAADQLDTDTIAFSLESIATGNYLVRAQVDGAESVLQTDTGGNFIGPKLEVL